MKATTIEELKKKRYCGLIYHKMPSVFKNDEVTYYLSVSRMSIDRFYPLSSIQDFESVVYIDDKDYLRYWSSLSEIL